MINDLISVVIRFHSDGDIKKLPDALKSVAFQSHPNVQAILTLQNCTDRQIAEITNLCDKVFFNQPEDYQRYKIINTELAKGIDGRCIIINKGLDIADGQYAAFLDYDDIIYQNAYEILITQNKTSSHSISVGKTIKANLKKYDNGQEYITSKEDFVDRKYNYVEIFYDNFIPLHSYIINLKSLPKEISRFDESFTLLEDYAFLLRIAQHGPLDLSKMDTPVCEYRFRESEPNTTLLYESCKKTENMWLEGRKKLTALKKDSKVFISMQDIEHVISNAKSGNDE